MPSLSEPIMVVQAVARILAGDLLLGKEAPCGWLMKKRRRSEAQSERHTMPRLIPVEKVHFTSKMELLDLLLRQNTTDGVGLRDFLVARRRPSGQNHAETTWDDIAFEVRTLTGQRVARESIINYAREFGLVPPRSTVTSADVVAAESE